jgi:hypothetical protein
MPYIDLPSPPLSHIEVPATNSYREAISYPGVVGTNHYGKCYRATRDIDVGTVVEHFDGSVVRYEDVPEEEIIYIGWRPNDGAWIIPQTNARYINHSCNPNCIANEQCEIIAIKPIEAGEEITIDYVTVTKEEAENIPEATFWDPRWTFQCKCGSENCYGLIDRYFVKE